MSWAARLATLSGATSPNADSADSPKKRPNDTNDTNDIGVFPGNRPFVDDPEERAAIQAGAMPVRHLRPRVAGQGQPQPGDYCGCCRGQLWWAETDTPKGWRCCRCHPPGHLQAGQFRAVAT